MFHNYNYASFRLLPERPLLLPYLSLSTLFSFQGAVPVFSKTRLKYSNYFEYFNLFLSGGDSRDRTGDLLLARQALSQLSYIPSSSQAPYPSPQRSRHVSLAPLPLLFLADTSARIWTGVTVLFFKWWARVGSNHRPYDYQSYALAS